MSSTAAGALGGAGGVRDRASALRIIAALRKGSNCLEGVGAFSVGRDVLFRAAAEELEELELTKGSVVRWLKGRYGHGKTHTFARLMELGHRRNWVTSYVQITLPKDGVELSRFNEVYAAIVQNCLCRDMVEEEGGQIEPGRRPGWQWILDEWCQGLRRQAGAATGGVPTLRLQDVVSHMMTSLQTKLGLAGNFAEALRQYALARTENDQEWVMILNAWFRGEDVHARGGEVRSRLRAAGIRESLTRRNAKEMLRCFSTFIRYRGFGGLMIMLDEVENVLEATRKARRGAYTILRELIDNVDDRHGMTTTCFYAAGTPDLFESDKGFTEYEALAERVLLPVGTGHSNPRAALVDLSNYPLSWQDLAKVAERIVKVYELARACSVSEDLRDEILGRLDSSLEKNPDLNVRAWVRSVVDVLDQRSSSATA